MQQSLDLTARRTVMSAMLYYGLDAPLLSDHEFDEGCKRLIREWADLSPIRQWQLGSPEELASTGYHIKVTLAAASGAACWAGLNVRPTAPWRRHRTHRVHWLNCGSFTPA